jgi:hypothetical protein
MPRRPLIALLATAAIFTSTAVAWDAPGHRTITLLALDRLSPDLPEFLRDPKTRAMIASQSCEPDRWRASSDPTVAHINSPDHYINLEPLADAGMKASEMPPLRFEYIAKLALLRDKDPTAFEKPDPAKDPGLSRVWPGFLPYAISENYAKLQISFKTLRMMESLNDPARADQIAQEKANVVYHMGVLSHFVGDAAQPLHTTRHHHGWVGDNQNGYTTRYSFHAEIDGGVLERHNLSHDTLKDSPRPDRAAGAANAFAFAQAEIQRSFDKVDPLYALDKSGTLLADEGKAFITERLTDAAATLSALYNAAWATSAPTDAEIRAFLKFDKWEEEKSRSDGVAK